MHVLTTHLGLDRRARAAQVDSLLGMQWLGGRRGEDPLVVCGDLPVVATLDVPGPAEQAAP